MLELDYSKNVSLSHKTFRRQSFFATVTKKVTKYFTISMENSQCNFKIKETKLYWNAISHKVHCAKQPTGWWLAFSPCWSCVCVYLCYLGQATLIELQTLYCIPRPLMGIEENRFFDFWKKWFFRVLYLNRGVQNWHFVAQATDSTNWITDLALHT